MTGPTIDAQIAAVRHMANTQLKWSTPLRAALATLEQVKREQRQAQTSIAAISEVVRRAR